MKRRRRFDPLMFLAGGLFTAFGIIGAATGADTIGNHIQWMWPLTCAVLGLGLLLSAAFRTPSRREDGAGDEIGAERGEYREV
ncbi:MAG: hypothetical protein ACRD0U_18370 [Acidimicrobiales bacterium]